MPLFSVVIPSYNASDTLEETLDAVLAQTYPDWECVVVDDGSTDATAAIAQAYASRDARIRVLSQANQGSGGAYNTGVRAAVSDYVVVCSADDILLPTHLEEVARFITAESGYDIYSTNGYFWRPDGSKEVVYPIETDSVKSLTFDDVLGRCFYSVGATYRRGLFDEVGGYRVEIFGEDYDFWLRAMARGATHRYLPLPLSLHRVSPTQKSARVATVHESDVAAIEHLISTGSLSPGMEEAARRAIADRGDLIRGVQFYGGRRESEVMAEMAEREAEALRSAVARVVPARFVDGVVAVARRAGRLARPLRTSLRGRRARAEARKAASERTQAAAGDGTEHGGE